MKKINKIKNRIFSLAVAALMFVMALLPTTAFASDFEVDSLNNRESTTGSASATNIKVDSDSATTNLVVKLTSTGETVTLYKLASVSYNSTNHSYDTPQWVEAVQNWLLAYDAYSTVTNDVRRIKSAYATPSALASASEATWSEFYNYLLYNTDSSYPLNVIDYGSASSTDNENNVTYTGKLLAYTDSVTLADDAESLEVSFNNIELGIYAVMVTGPKRFAPVVKDLTPKVNGPEGNYYVDSVYYAELKASEATIDKKINQRQSDTVSVGQVVDFDIDVVLPSLYNDRVTYTNTMDSVYYLYIEDYMSPAFALCDANGAFATGDTNLTDIIDLRSRQNASAEMEDFSLDNVTYYEIADSTYSKSGLVEGTDYFTLTDENISTYTFTCQELADLEGYVAGNTYYAIKCSAPLYTIDRLTTKVNSADSVECQYIKLNINVGVLKQMVKELEGARSYDSAIVTMSYKAKVTPQVAVGTDTNYNTANIVYEGSLGVSDTARAYTYGVQINKLDGDTNEALAGAVFNLYKEVNTYVRPANATEDSQYVFAADMAGTGTDTIGKTIAEIREDIRENGSESPYYIYEMTATEAGTTDLGVEYTAGQSVLRVFKLFTNGYVDSNTVYDGSVTSIASEKGVVVKGLDEGNYVLAEVKAPRGYNELAEDVLFTIDRIDDETAQLEFNGSLSGFYDSKNPASRNLIESGIKILTILNYRGLMLPSTGGKGILLFTMLGICLMSAAMVLMIVKQTKRDASSYM